MRINQHKSYYIRRDVSFDATREEKREREKKKNSKHLNYNNNRFGIENNTIRHDRYDRTQNVKRVMPRHQRSLLNG